MKVAKLSDASLRWLAALYDPRGCMEEPSVPFETGLSQKIKTFSRGSFATGTTGFGFIAVNPCAMITSDQDPIICTQSSSVGGSATQCNSFSNLVSSATANAPYASTSYGPGVGKLSWKLVGCALYVKYADTALNKGGDMTMIETPDHSDIYTTMTYTKALNYDAAKRVKITDDWQHVCWTPAISTESDYSTVVPLSGGGVSANYTQAMFVQSAGAASRAFDYEVYCWFEAVGTLARGATISFNDPIGFGAVSGAVDQFQQLDSVVGARGLVKAVECQFNNMSGIMMNATHTQNWAGLTSFLPALSALAERAAPVLRGAADGALAALGYVKANSERSHSVPAPPPPPSRHYPGSASLLASLQQQKSRLKSTPSRAVVPVTQGPPRAPRKHGF